MDLTLTKQLLEELWNNVTDNEFQDVSNSTLQPIIQNLRTLQGIYNKILANKESLRTTENLRSPLQLLNQTNLLQFDYNHVTEDIAKNIFDAYFLTEQILHQLGLIKQVNYVISYNSRAGNVYYRQEGAENLVFGETVKFELHHGVGRLRLQSQKIKAKAQKNPIPEIQQHYKDFIAPLRKSKAFKPGYATEAFERHWEQLKHSTEHLESLSSTEFVGKKAIKEVWRLYLMSMGRDAYYTGPDTSLSQVKRQNASLISDMNTVLYTIQTILNLTLGKSGGVWTKELALNLKKVFSQNNSSPKLTQEQIVALGIEDTVTNEILYKYFKK